MTWVFQITTDRSGPTKTVASFPAEVAAVWTLLAVLAVAIFVTYTRLPAADLYNVSGSGPIGGASRALVFVNYPVALVAIAVLAVLFHSLARPSAKAVALIGIALSAAIFWPGIVMESDLDARPVNAIAALGVLTAFVLTLAAARGRARPVWAGRQPDDALRIVLGALALALAVPWIVAGLGLSLTGVPVLGSLYQTSELRSQPGVSELSPAVHFGHHHGMDGVILVLSALLISRLLPSLAPGRLRGLLGAYLALMFCYGAANLVQDFWLEQIVKRGWTGWELPNVTTPKVSVAWAVIILAATALWGVAAWRSRSSRTAPIAPSAEVA